MSDTADLFNQALTAIDRGQHDLAIDRLQRVVNAAPDDREAVQLLAQTLRDAGHDHDAEVVLVAATRRAPDHVAAWLDLAALRLETGRPGPAADACKHALLQDPNHWEALYLLGNAFFDAQAFPEAIKAYRLGLESNPFEPELWHNLAAALDQSGQPAEARPAWDAYERLSRDLGARPDATVAPDLSVGPPDPER